MRPTIELEHEFFPSFTGEKSPDSFGNGRSMSPENVRWFVWAAKSLSAGLENAKSIPDHLSTRRTVSTKRFVYFKIQSL